MKKAQGSSRRRYSTAEKARILSACEEPGASIAAVAQAHGVKASLVHQWRYVAKADKAKASVFTRQGEFVPVALAAPSQDVAHAASEAIRVELRRGATTVQVQWPLSASSTCGAWLRELLG